MNILLKFLESQTSLKGIDIKNNIDLKNGKKIALQVPQVFNNTLEAQLEMILLTPKDTICDSLVQELIKVLDFLHHNQTKVIFDTKKYIIDFSWDKKIIFNSLNEMSSPLSTIRFKIKITEVK